MKEAAIGTKQKILDAAEGLFAEHGVAGTSLRAVIAEAGVNLAAVHYHFGSKDALVAAVVHRRVEPVNQERISMLDSYESGAGRKGRLSVEMIVRAFVTPILQVCQDPEHGEMFAKLMGRMMAEPDYFFGKVAPRQFCHVRDRFVAAFGKALPKVPQTEIFWRMMFAIGAMTHALRIGSRVTDMSGGDL